MSVFKNNGSNYVLILEEYCENCPHFVVEDDSTEYESKYYADPTRYFHRISCKNMTICDKIYAHIKKKINEQQEKEKDNEKTS